MTPVGVVGWHLGSGRCQAARHHPHCEPGRQGGSDRTTGRPGERRTPSLPPGPHPLGPWVRGHLSSQTLYPKGRHLGVQSHPGGLDLQGGHTGGRAASPPDGTSQETPVLRAEVPSGGEKELPGSSGSPTGRERGFSFPEKPTPSNKPNEPTAQHESPSREDFPHLPSCRSPRGPVQALGTSTPPIRGPSLVIKEPSQACFYAPAASPSLNHGWLGTGPPEGRQRGRLHTPVSSFSVHPSLPCRRVCGEQGGRHPGAKETSLADRR